MKKRLLAIILMISLLLSVVPFGTVMPMAATVSNDVTITVLDKEGNNVTNSNLQVTVTHVYGRYFTTSESIAVTPYGGGVFGYNWSKNNSSTTKYYQVSARLTENGVTYSKNVQVAKSATSVVVTLDNFVQQDKWARFDVYYIADGRFPNSFYGSGNYEDYGPAGNDTPLLSINVNITKLQSSTYAEDVLYEENVHNIYHFVPAKQSSLTDIDERHKQNLDYATKFWEAVKKCMDKETVEAFEATGLYDTFIGYCLKNQGNAQIADNHCDGVLSVKPPVYVIEMYDHEGKIFGGHTNDIETIENNAVSMETILEAYNDHFKQKIDWVKDSEGVWSGHYITTENGKKYRYNLQIVQTNIEQATGFTSSKGIKYQQKTSTYYLAAFKSAIILPVERVDFIVTYSDGLNNKVFNSQVTSVDRGEPVVEFTGDTYRRDFKFLGWTLKGGDGTILSQDDILETYKSVTSDLTFEAIYMAAPEKHTGTVEVILDGYYDSTNATATGEKIDITEVLGNNISLAVSADGVEFIPLVSNSRGVYSAELLNGDYSIYYYNGSAYTLADDQILTINYEDRTRYLFFEQVIYDLNGGVGGPAELVEYYHTGAEVKATTGVPTREGYLFKGWLAQNGKTYYANDVVTSAIEGTYTLTAQWVDAADIYVNVTINHIEAVSGAHDDGGLKDDIKLDLVYTADVNTPYLESGDHIILSSTSHINHNYTFEPENASDEDAILKTVYTAKAPSVMGVEKEYLYSVAVSKHDYDVTYLNTRPLENGDIVIDVELTYAPDNQDLEFEVEVAKDVPAELLPQAAIVKVVYWSVENGKWEFIVEHENVGDVIKPGIRVDIDKTTRKGSGTYSVWTNELLENGTIQPYGYRIVVTALVYPDGTIVRMNQDYLEDLAKNNTDVYYVTIDDVNSDRIYSSYEGVYFEGDAQIGGLKAIIDADAFDVTFNAMGGSVNGVGEYIVTDQYKVPDFDGYVLSRNGAYVFDGWYKDAACTIPAVKGEYLTSDITLYAKWKAPLTVSGLITVGATYEKENDGSTKTIHNIPDSELASSIIVILQKVEPNGYTETVKSITVNLDYTNKDYYNGDRKVGYAYYSFGEIPDIGLNYRVQVLLPNYHPTFQNEDKSLTEALKYPTYNHEDYIAVFGTTDPLVATVNVHTHFSPEEYVLKYSVNAEAIGNGYRPLKTEVLITYDDYHSGATPSEWNVISQMIVNNKYAGDFIEITNGKGASSSLVWIRRSDGVSIYEYGIRLEDIILADGTTVQLSGSLPFTVEYDGIAYYTENGQSDELIATLKPNVYNIKYNLNGGSLSGNYPTEHTWSYETSIAGIVPTLNGFKFMGWYLDEKFTQPADDYIDASVAYDVNLYAKWIQVMDSVDLIVTIKHNQLGNDSGLASNYNKTLYTQLTYADRNLPAAEQVFVDMQGFKKDYRNGFWHTHGDNVQMDIFEVPSYYTNLTSEYDYAVNVLLEGYYVADKKITKTELPDGSTRHTVEITLQYNPDVFNLQFYVAMANDVPKGAYPKSAEVKVTSWYDDPAADTSLDWYRITQHKLTTITVEIDPEKGYGKGEYPVWHWFDEENNIPYYYRIEVIQLNFSDGTVVPMNETLADVSYSGGGYNAQIVVDENGVVPEMDKETQISTTLSGVYATGEHYEHTQMGTVGAVIDVNKVIFHANNEDAIGSDDIFRTYYPSAAANNGLYTLNADGTIPAFYEIPEFEYDVHNNYIFKGWYLDKDSTENPVNWNTVYDSTTHIYAHWIETGSVAKEEDNKQLADTEYQGFDLIGVQIRDKDIDTGVYYGTPSSGLRFIAVLSEDVYAQINALEGNASGAEYGFVLARSSTAQRNAGDALDYTLQYKDVNVNGEDTSADYSYVQNFKCSGVQDHYDGEEYRLYTAVITYKNYTGEQLEQEYNQSFAARAYIRYYDANGMLRTYYNNYTGTHFYGGCSTSFAAVRDAVTK